MDLYIGFIFLIVAFSVSTISAYFSIVGLVALFAANPIPIILMGSVLEIAKIASALWLHRFWNESPILVKSYLLSAVIILMLITSLGIFGFLSKSHLDQNLPNEITKNEILTIDLEINQIQLKIENEKNKLVDLNKLIDGYIKNDRITQTKKLLEEQKEEREKININISKLQTELLQLNSKKLIKENELTGIEAKLGPLQYFTELFGIKDKNSAVRILILILIFVFDPIAIFLAIAGQWTIMHNIKKVKYDNYNKFETHEISDNDFVLEEKYEEPEIILEPNTKNIPKNLKNID